MKKGYEKGKKFFIFFFLISLIVVVENTIANGKLTRDKSLNLVEKSRGSCKYVNVPHAPPPAQVFFSKFVSEKMEEINTRRFFSFFFFGNEKEDGDDEGEAEDEMIVFIIGKVY